MHHAVVLPFAVALATAAVPMMRPLENRLCFAVERWADEEGARETGRAPGIARLCVDTTTPTP
jgi:hypothetical protein